jgi:hypothetical protein
MRHSIKNIALTGADSDTGWQVAHEGRCYTTWHRRVESGKSPDALAREMLGAGDYPGWTGVEYSEGLSDGEIHVFVSTWDSGD